MSRIHITLYYKATSMSFLTDRTLTYPIYFSIILLHLSQKEYLLLTNVNKCKQSILANLLQRIKLRSSTRNDVARVRRISIPHTLYKKLFSDNIFIIHWYFHIWIKKDDISKHPILSLYANFYDLIASFALLSDQPSNKSNQK